MHSSLASCRIICVGPVMACGRASTHLARFSEAFLVLRASTLVLSSSAVPLIMAVMNVAYAASSYPAGHLSDQVGRPNVCPGLWCSSSECQRGLCGARFQYLLAF
jgi:MFS family permease